jgi:flagellar protein FlgJ
MQTAPIATPGLAQISAPGTSPNNPKKLEHAAADFEALLVGQMLKSSREAGGVSLAGEDDQEANSSLLDLGEQQFAQALASKGALGIAKMIVKGFNSHANR